MTFELDPEMGGAGRGKHGDLGGKCLGRTGRVMQRPGQSGGMGKGSRLGELLTAPPRLPQSFPAEGCGGIVQPCRESEFTNPIWKAAGLPCSLRHWDSSCLPSRCHLEGAQSTSLEGSLSWFWSVPASGVEYGRD